MFVKGGLIYPDLSYTLTGILFSVHNDIGIFGKEKQYADLLAKKLEIQKIPFLRERDIGDSGNRIDFIVYQKFLIELKAKRGLTKEDYIQTQRYLQETGLRLGLLVNFRESYLKPKRIIRIDTEQKKKCI